MASSNAVYFALSIFERANLANPPEGEPNAIVALWAETLDGLSDSEVLDAARAWLAQDNPWHPRPGQLIALVPDHKRSEDACRLLRERCPCAPAGDPDRLQNVDRHRLESLTYATTARFGHPGDIGSTTWQRHYRALLRALQSVPADRRLVMQQLPGGVRRVLTAEARKVLSAHMLPLHLAGQTDQGLPAPEEVAGLLPNHPDRTPQGSQ